MVRYKNISQVRQRALAGLANLTENAYSEQDWFSTGMIAITTTQMYLKGEIKVETPQSQDVEGLLDPFVNEGLVLQIRYVEGSGEPFRYKVGYRVDIGKKDRIKDETKDL